MQEAYHSTEYYDEYPVVNIDHTAALMYCKWLTDFYREKYGTAFPEGAYFKLPTLAEWTRAALGEAMAMNIYPDYPGLVNGKGCGIANIGETERVVNTDPKGVNTAIKPSINDNFPWIAPIYTYLPNENGLYNLIGNVSEMLIDHPRKAIGGNWTSTVEEATIKHTMDFLSPSPLVGMRLVLVVPE